MITLKQLAELSGYSVRTVQRVLSGQAHVTPEKREKILALAKEHQYVPNMAARNLRLQKKNFVGILFEDFNVSASLNKLNSLDRMLMENGYFPMLGKVQPDNERELDQLMVHWSGVAEYAVVFHGASGNFQDHLLKHCGRYPLKLIFVDNYSDYGDYSVKVDRQGSVYEMLCRLDAMKFRHLVYCGNLKSRSGGVQMAQDDPSLQMKISRLDAADYNFESGEAIGAEVMNSGADVVFFDTDRMACGFYRYAAGHGIRIPEDISVVGFDNEQYCELQNPPLSTLAHPVHELAARVLQIIRTGQAVDDSPLKLKFIPRESLLKK